MNSESDGGYASNTDCYAGYSNCCRTFRKIGVGFIDYGACARVIDFHEERGARRCQGSIGWPGGNEKKWGWCDSDGGSGR